MSISTLLFSMVLFENAVCYGQNFSVLSYDTHVARTQVLRIRMMGVCVSCCAAKLWRTCTNNTARRKDCDQ